MIVKEDQLLNTPAVLMRTVRLWLLSE